MGCGVSFTAVSVEIAEFLKLPNDRLKFKLPCTPSPNTNIAMAAVLAKRNRMRLRDCHKFATKHKKYVYVPENGRIINATSFSIS